MTVQELTAELTEKGPLPLSGRANRPYFTDKPCYGGAERKAP